MARRGNILAANVSHPVESAMPDYAQTNDATLTANTNRVVGTRVCDTLLTNSGNHVSDGGVVLGGAYDELALTELGTVWARGIPRIHRVKVRAADFSGSQTARSDGSVVKMYGALPTSDGMTGSLASGGAVIVDSCHVYTKAGVAAASGTAATAAFLSVGIAPSASGPTGSSTTWATATVTEESGRYAYKSNVFVTGKWGGHGAVTGETGGADFDHGRSAMPGYSLSWLPSISTRVGQPQARHLNTAHIAVELWAQQSGGSALALTNVTVGEIYLFFRYWELPRIP